MDAPIIEKKILPHRSKVWKLKYHNLNVFLSEILPMPEETTVPNPEPAPLTKEADPVSYHGDIQMTPSD